MSTHYEDKICDCKDRSNLDAVRVFSYQISNAIYYFVKDSVQVPLTVFGSDLYLCFNF